MNIAVNLPQAYPASWKIASGAMEYATETDDVAILLPKAPVMGAGFCDPKCWDGLITRRQDYDFDERLPQVSVSPAHSGDLISATIDEDMVAKLAVDQFESMGLRHVAYFGHHGWPLSELRWHCFSRQVEKVGRKPIFVSSVMKEKPLEALQKLRKPCGILVYDDDLGVKLLDLCSRINLRVPGDLQVISVGDTPVCLQTSPTLSSITLPYSQVGYYATKLCAQLIKGEAAESVKIPPSGLIIRDSLKIETESIRTATEIAHYLRTNLSYPIQMDDIARLSNVTRRQLEKSFRATYDSSPMAYLKKLRLEQAKEMLRTTDTKLRDVANACGYTNSNHLCRVFRERVGLSPVQYREEHMEK